MSCQLRGAGCRPQRCGRTAPRVRGQASRAAARRVPGEQGGSAAGSCRSRRSVAPTATANDQDGVGSASLLDGEDFYGILGVKPTASAAEIKRAYYGLMKQCHPDRSVSSSSDSDDDGGYTDLCAILNEIYAVLSDEEQRAQYDLLAGYSGNSINPFFDPSFEADQVFVDEITCIGCRNCNNVCPATFEMEPEYGRARVAKQDADEPDIIQEAIDTCPVSCIHWVSAPQLALLEEEMRKMERISIAALRTGGGGRVGADVFRQASFSWEKRAAEVRAKAQEAVGGAPNAWESAVGAVDSAANAQEAWQTGGNDPAAARRMAKTAARAARQWREYSRRQAEREFAGLSLSELSTASLDSIDMDEAVQADR
ncbi:unnamed protein product [Pedinophyceae sp. YPF-701]|nr:unnamed protein product [Pedinophyceae sp. YPF-701]